MLADPFGNRLVAGQSPNEDQGRVEFLVEVCDPPEDAQFAYTSNGILVSDFLTPHYYDPVTSSGVRYSYTGAIQAPRTVLQGGYLSWHDPVSDHWFQEQFFDGNKPKFTDLGKLSAKSGKNFRRLIYDKTEEAFETRKPTSQQVQRVTAAMLAASKPTTSKAVA